MTHALLLGLLLQAPAAAPKASPATPPQSLAYRGFSPGMAYRDFASKARGMAQTSKDVLACQTMHHTAQVMDCAVPVRDPADSARFYLSANVIEGRTSVISLFDSGSVSLLKRTQDDMRLKLGAPQRRERSMWEWSHERKFVRLNWRGGKTWRVVSITFNDRDVMDRIAKYRPPQASKSKSK
ncbi:MAG TPA: hypothetical protein VFO67_10520 [Gemmatimonadales bacterium]|nr:hypothetical protein [Gemmatimonadales bacterium]